MRSSKIWLSSMITMVGSSAMGRLRARFRRLDRDARSAARLGFDLDRVARASELVLDRAEAHAVAGEVVGGLAGRDSGDEGQSGAGGRLPAARGLAPERVQIEAGPVVDEIDRHAVRELAARELDAADFRLVPFAPLGRRLHAV